MQVYTARQAVLNTNETVVAYELLFRDGDKNSFPDIDPHKATGKLIMNTHLNQGLSEVTGGKKALINFTEKCLLSNYAEILPPKKVIIEILESVTPSDEVYNRCEELHKKGYTLALDDFVYSKEWSRFFKLVKLIKFDISKTPLDTIGKLVSQIKSKYRKIKILAERVETVEEFNKAKALGFDFFQGYYFFKPEIRKSIDIEPNYTSLFRVIKEFKKEKTDLLTVSKIFESDVGLAYKLLSFINSDTVKNTQPIGSISKAIVYLGPSKLKHLMVLLATATLTNNGSGEVFNMSVVRAKTCEMVADKIAPGMKEEAFLTGLLSLIGPMLGKTNKEVLNRMPVSDEIKKAILGGKEQTLLRMILKASELVQEGSWHLTTIECLKLRIDYDWLCGKLKEAIVWSDSFQKKLQSLS